MDKNNNLINIRVCKDSSTDLIFFSLVDFTNFLIGDDLKSNRWKYLKRQIKKKDLSALKGVVSIKLPSHADGKFYSTDCAILTDLLKISLFVPGAPASEVLRDWLVKLTEEHIKTK